MDPEEVQAMVMRGMTHGEISSELCSRSPYEKGLSARIIRKFCAKHHISKPKGHELDKLVATAVEEVCNITGCLVVG